MSRRHLRFCPKQLPSSATGSKRHARMTRRSPTQYSSTSTAQQHHHSSSMTDDAMMMAPKPTHPSRPTTPIPLTPSAQSPSSQQPQYLSDLRCSIRSMSQTGNEFRCSPKITEVTNITIKKLQSCIFACFRRPNISDLDDKLGGTEVGFNWGGIGPAPVGAWQLQREQPHNRRMRGAAPDEECTPWPGSEVGAGQQPHHPQGPPHHRTAAPARPGRPVAPARSAAMPRGGRGRGGGVS